MVSKRKITLLLITIIFSLSVLANRVEHVTAKYTLYASDDISIEYAKLKALERAKIEAIEQAFGSNVSQLNTTSIETDNDNSNLVFSSYSSSDVRGEWIETTSEPIYEIAYSNHLLIVKVKVAGVIREITSNNDVHVKILKNGIEPQFESYEFYEGDQMYISLVSSIKGYIVIYLLDNKNHAYRLLPYRKQEECSILLEGSKEEIFFNKDIVDISHKRIVDEYILTSNQQVEINTIYVVFSPNELYKAIDIHTKNDMPCELSGTEFYNWLTTLRNKDNILIVKEIPIIIQKRK